ncbi:MAG: glycosyltransferase [Elusimicrobiales bacterium]|nr:glycosyltransferase [Elusimicrobiales bacterium]
MPAIRRSDPAAANETAAVSVLIVTRGRPGLLRACLSSVLAGGKVEEVLVGVDGQDPDSFAVLGEFGGAVRPVPLPRMCRGEARNRLAAAARGRWLCFLDDDTVVPAGYFSRLQTLILDWPDAAVFGGGQLRAPEAGAFETAVFHLLASPWGSGPFGPRFSPVAGTRLAGPEKFILCNLTLDSFVLRRLGAAFEGHLTSAEENLLLNRLAAQGAQMVLSGDLNLVHRRRKGLAAFLRQVFSSGRGRGQITLRSPLGFSAFTLIPPLFLCGLSLAAALRPGAAGALLAAYCACCVLAAAVSGAPTARKAGVAALFPVLHGGYAAGWLYGCLEGLAEKLAMREKPARCYCEEKP